MAAFGVSFKKAEKDKIWMMFLDMDPNDPGTVFAGGLRVWRTRTAGDTWKAVTDELDESPITAVEVARDSQTIYIGTEHGGIFRSSDGGETWSGNLAGPLPGFTVTRLHASPAIHAMATRCRRVVCLRGWRP